MTLLLHLLLVLLDSFMGADWFFINLAIGRCPTAVPVLGCSCLAQSLTHNLLTSRPPQGHIFGFSLGEKHE